MRFAQLIALAGLVFAGTVSAADEASIYRQVRSLQQTPEASQREWLEALQDYRSEEMIDLQESRQPLLVPRYPIAAAARAALQQLDVAEMLTRLQQSDSALPADWSDPVTLKAWITWLDSTPHFPGALHSPEVRTSDWPESLLRAISKHPDAPAQYLETLLARAKTGASLRWLDTVLPTLAASSLHRGETNPALAESVWTEWARRANANDPLASNHLRRVTQQSPATPGLAAGLARWKEADTVLVSLSKSARPENAQQRLARLVQLRQKVGANNSGEQP